jgi:hypothetical protein
MIQLSLFNFHWGTSSHPGYENARQINIKDPESTLEFSFAFGDQPLVDLILELSLGLTDEQKAHVAERVTVYTEADLEAARAASGQNNG